MENKYNHKQIENKRPASAKASGEQAKEIYDHRTIEIKWQKRWEQSQIYKTTEESDKENFYALDMFPYPSGDGLHVGHPKGYISTDIFSRMKKMQGHNVLHPMGWDAFGLPAENFAIKNKIHPRVAVEKNIKRFKEQLNKIGFNYDWEREINTTDPKFYKWTQWIFIKLFEKGLAYESYEPINWCPSCQTGLANEDLEDGKCERCGSVVEKKPMRQWILKITDYAEKLLEGLEELDWPEYIKESQRNWIGKSDGALINFQIDSSDQSIEVFTTRADTLFGVTYLVLAPEHSIIKSLIKRIENIEEIEKYIRAIENKTEIERTDAKKEKTGVLIEGIEAINPATGEKMPIWIADYVLGNYGTGAVMAVPAHDERDFEFAKKYNLRVKDVVIPIMPDPNNPHKEGKEIVFRDAVIAVLKDNKSERYLCLKWKKQPWVTFVMGGIEKGESALEAAIREIKEETGYRNFKFVKELGLAQSEFFAAHKDVNRVAHTRELLFELVDYEQDELSAEESDIHELEWRTLEGINQKDMTHSEMPLILKNLNNEKEAFTSEGVLFDSGEFTRMKSEEAREKIVKKYGQKITKYKIKDWVFSRQRYWGEPIPIIHCDKCGVIPVKEEDLPVKLPEVEHYEPTGTGESPLTNIDDWVNTICPKCGGIGKRETNTMPQWAGSSWYYLRYLDPENDGELVNKEKEKKWLPVSTYVGGAEHATRHLIYARFWHKFLKDIGVVESNEPFKRLQNVGLIHAEDGRKMSKRFGNVINPDDIVETWGADTLRLYEMFMGPFGDGIAWKTDNMIGVRRFLERVWKLKNKTTKEYSEENKEKLDYEKNKVIKKVTEDIESYKFNTAISAMMIYANHLEAIGKTIRKEEYETLLKLLAPFAPHITEELWAGMGNNNSIHLEEWPKYDESKIKETKATIVVQVNGKIRGHLETDVNTDEKTAKERALSLPEIKKLLGNSEVKRVIFVRGKILNLIV